MNAEIAILDLETLIEARDFVSLRKQIRNWPAGDLAELMEPLSADKEAVVFRLLPRDEAAQIFAYLPTERQQELLKAMAQEEVVNILNEMSDDDRTELLEELPAQVTQRLLNMLSPEERRRASLLLGYAENSVGRLMTPHFVRLRPHSTVAQALDHIRKYGVDSETMSIVYVIDEHGKLIDDLRNDFGSDGFALRGAQSHRRSGSGSRGISRSRPERAARHRYRWRADRDRYRR
jgi:magnesium transporter